MARLGLPIGDVAVDKGNQKLAIPLWDDKFIEARFTSLSLVIDIFDTVDIEATLGDSM